MENRKVSKHNNEYDEGRASDIDRRMFSIAKHFANNTLCLGLPVLLYCSLDLALFDSQLSIFSIGSRQLLGF